MLPCVEGAHKRETSGRFGCPEEAPERSASHESRFPFSSIRTEVYHGALEPIGPTRIRIREPCSADLRSPGVRPFGVPKEAPLDAESTWLGFARRTYVRERGEEIA
jgi:hypothetical protein